MKQSILKSGALALAVLCASALVAGPEQDFDAAVKAGKPLSAEAAYLKLVKSSAKVAPIRHYQAAQVADQLGKATLRKDRLMLFVRMEKGWTPEVEQALWILATSNAGIEYYERLAANLQPTRTLWQVGSDLLDQLDAANRATEVLRLSDILLGKFPEPNRRTRVIDVLGNNSQRAGEGYPAKDLTDVVMRHPGLGNTSSFGIIVRSNRLIPALGSDFAVRYAVKHGEVSDWALSTPISALEGLAGAKEPEKVREREERAADLRKLRKLCFDGRHPESALCYFRVATLRLPKLFFKEVSTNGTIAGACAMYKELAGQKQYAADGNFRNRVNMARNEAIGQRRFTSQEIASLIDAAPDQFYIDQLANWSSLGNVIAAANKEKSAAPIVKLAQKFPKQADEIYRAYFWHFAAHKGGEGDIPAVKRIFADIVRQNRDFDFSPVDAILSQCKSMSVADKVALFKSAYAQTGFNRAWKTLRQHADKAKDPKSVFADPAVKAFAATIKDDALPGDPMFRAAVLFGRAKTPAEAHAAAAEFGKAFPSRFGEAKDARDNRIAQGLVERYFDLIRNASAGDCRKWVEFALPKCSKAWKGDGGYFGHAIRKADNDMALWTKYGARMAEITGTHDAYAGLTVAKDSEKTLDGVDMRKMTLGNAATYFFNNWRALKPGAARDKLTVDFFASHPVDTNLFTYINGAVEMAFYSSLNATEINKAVVDRLPLAKLEDLAFAKPYSSVYHDVLFNLMRLAHRQGRVSDAIKRYVAWAAGRDPRDRINSLLYISNLQLQMPPKEKGQNPYNTWLVDGKDFAAYLKDGLLPAFAALPPVQASTFDFNCSGLWSRLWDVLRYSKDEALLQSSKDCWTAMTKLVLAGARNTEGVRGGESQGWTDLLERAIAAKDPAAAARVARKAGASLGVNWVGEARVKAILEGFAALGNNEAFYLYVDAIPGDEPSWLIAEAAKARGALASSLPGIYPVGENDPAYPLYVAADELAKKNPERAWQILKDPKIQPVFEREALKLPPDFVVWGVEQMRMERGAKEELLLKARQIATAVIAQEGKVAPELVAAMILSRAEGFRDQQNFEAAKLEYQSIRDNPTYHATKYGKKAMFRAVDLQIASGNAQGVEATLEYWLSQNDREIQAEAHYFLAKLAFERKDYDECVKQLRQVFAIDYTHTEGRFLQGEWKLATNSEVDETEVLVGKLGDRNMIKPGNQFTITVQDSNLSVAGGGASIPVIVTTEPGHDAERVNLYPTSRDPSNFKGLVEVVLGKANPSNRVLEVVGNDTVSYVIDPAFLKARGLALNEPKRLHVIDDAKIAIGAGAPRTEESKTEKGVKDLLADGATADDSVTMRLRPGNPLYVVVQDRDCSLGGAADTVRVTLETSSGDRVEGLELKEEKPFTGVFRGKVETSLPPPRAFASDTAAGLNPGDVINSGKTGGWRSLADNQPGKWFEVDTMAAPTFSEITLETPSVADIKSIKLVGRMGSRTLALGRLPAATEMSKFRLRRQQQYDTSRIRSVDQLRAFCQTDKAAKPYIVEKLEFRVLHKGRNARTQSAFYHGPFEIPEGVDSLRLRIAQKSAAKDALKGLWVALALDGEEVFSGQGCKLQDALVSADVTAGCHQFEFAVVANTNDDDFDLLWEPLGKDPQPLPADWFDEEKHASLHKFVKDLAQIVKTEKGFKAIFDKPVRLRTFRWEFADLKSPDVAVTRIAAKDVNGEAVLPVASDFSDAQSNGTLEVAPGDKIVFTYEDERTTTGEKKVLQRQMDSSFNDAKARFIFEEANDSGQVVPYDAFRFQPGDALVLAVSDPDCDTTPEADKIEVTIKNRVGEEVTKKLIEYQPKWLHLAGSGDGTMGMHTGLFMGILKTCHEGDTNAPARVMRVKSDDLLTLSYEDRENTDPGVPCARSVRIFAARPSNPEMTLFDVRKTREVDTSADAKVLLERIRRRPGNENVQVVYHDVLTAAPMAKEALATTNPIPVNVSAGFIPVRVNDRSRARHAGSRVVIEAVAHSELAKAKAEGRDPEVVSVPLHLGGSLGALKLTKGSETPKEALAAGTFNGIINLSLGPLDPNIELPANAPPMLCVTGSDLVDITVLSAEGEPVLKRTVKLVSDGTIGLTDSTFTAEREAAHIGESFFVMVDDADRDLTEEADKIEAEVKSVKTGRARKIVLNETMPHSGVFTGRLRPMMFAPGETIPSVATGGVASAHEVLTEERFAVGYGDQVIFRYRDEVTLPGTPARTLAATGTVYRGANGAVRLFSKRFTDRDMAVLVQFRLAECLFEQAKEHRKLKQPEKSSAAIAEGKFILEEALKNYPDSAHVVQGEYLLANLYQELAAEQKEADEMEKAIPLYQEALSRFSTILGTWPESEFAAKSQYHKALCLEMLQDYGRASEEYVKMTYLYPESELVGEATIRLATYYYTKEKRYDISGHIYQNFQQRFPQHAKAARALFMAGSCYVKQAETLAAENEKLREQNQPAVKGSEQRISDCYKQAVGTFDALVETYRDSDQKLKAQALYWAGDICVRCSDYTKAYQYLKRTVFEYPETEWARRARGLLLQEGKNFKDFE